MFLLFFRIRKISINNYFFFSSRRRHTSSKRDWSSDVCSSDLRRRATASSDSGPKLKPIDREQGLLRPVIVEELVGPDHRARAIWDLTGELDLQAFYGGIRSREAGWGSSAWDPRLLLSIWLYSYSEQVSSSGDRTADGVRTG